MSLRSGTRRLTRSISINATPEGLWDSITRIDTIADWYDSWDCVVSVDAEHHLREGTYFRLIRRHTRRTDEVAHCRVTEVLELTRLQWMQSVPNEPIASIAFELIPNTAAGTTELRHTRSWITGQHLSAYNEGRP